MKKLENIKQVLFINFGGIGDEILFFPTIKDFKEQYPEAQITLLLEPRSAGSVNLTNTVDETITYDIKNTNNVTAFFSLLQLLRQGRYDTVISAGSNKFICVLLFLSGIKNRIGYDSGVLSRKLLSSAIGLNKRQYAANMYHDLLKGVGIDKNTPLPEIIIPQQAINKAEQMLGEKDKPFIVIHPGVSKLSIQKNIIKSWPEQNWAELICSLLETTNYKVVLTGGPDDETTILHIRAILEQQNIDKTYFIDLYGKTKNLIELAAVIKLSNILLCVDSAPMHIAVGVGTKVVAIFGPTDENKLLPKNNDFLAMVNSDLTCRPCLWDKRNEVCNQALCLDISVDHIFSVINTQQI